MPLDQGFMVAIALLEIYYKKQDSLQNPLFVKSKNLR